MPQADADRFVADISAWVRQQKSNQDLFFRGVCLGALGRVQELTPVDTGRLRASWQLEPALEAIHAGATVSIVTNVVYARRIDEGFVGVDSLGRHYHQRGVHMVERTIAALPEIAAQVEKDLK
jgi:hypothetical protein